MSRARSRARRCALQALYQWQLSGQEIEDIESQFFAEQDLKQVDTAYFSGLLRSVQINRDKLDAELMPFLDRAISGLDPVELAILRIGACELAYYPDVPFRVVINEAVELAKTFGAEQSHCYINGVLDKVARKLRPAEQRLNVT